MSASISLLEKVRRKGLRNSLHVFSQRFFYCHLEFILVDRPLNLSISPAPPGQPWRWEEVGHKLLPAFKKHFASQLASIEKLIDENYRGHVYLDEDGHVILMIWASESGYYIDKHYRCQINVPDNYIFQFALECSPLYRGLGLASLSQKLMWDKYRRHGFTGTRAMVNVLNEPALKLHANLGFQEIGESIHIYRVLGVLHFHRRARYEHPRLLPQYKKPPTLPLVPSVNIEKERL